LSKRLVPLSFFSNRVSDKDNREMANAILKFHNKDLPDSQEMPIAEIFANKTT